MNFQESPIKGVYIIELTPREDQRGSFSRTFCEKEFKQIGFNEKWVQINHSITKLKGTIRGLHFQKPPYCEIKLVRCIKGKIFDTIVDLRKESETYLHHFSIELSESNNKMLLIAQNCAHGFQTLTDDCHIIYHHSNFYTPEAEDGILYNDKLLNINWPLVVTEISDRDKSFNKL